MSLATTEFRVRRGDLRRTEIGHTYAEPGPGQIRLKVDHFALTSNNITYAAFGEMMRYWQFFPAPDGWGIVPVWGFATVTESLVPEIAVGARFYGYWPMASHAILTPGKFRGGGFSDIAAHRDGLASVYNSYLPALCDDEARYALFRPLYITSFLIDDSLAESVPGVGQVLLSSASSKTALGLAQALQVRGVKVIGLTSPGNMAFVTSTGLYDAVLAYEAIESLDSAVSTAFVDFAGNAATRARIHQHFGDALVASLMIGATDWDAPRGDATPLPGANPEMFFAPTVLAQRLAEWGPGGFDSRVTKAWDSFIDTTHDWLVLVRDHGVAAAEKHYRDLVEGRVDPQQGIMLTLG